VACGWTEEVVGAQLYPCGHIDTAGIAEVDGTGVATGVETFLTVFGGLLTGAVGVSTAVVGIIGIEVVAESSTGV